MYGWLVIGMVACAVATSTSEDDLRRGLLERAAARRIFEEAHALGQYLDRSHATVYQAVLDASVLPSSSSTVVNGTASRASSLQRVQAMMRNHNLLRAAHSGALKLRAVAMKRMQTQGRGRAKDVLDPRQAPRAASRLQIQTLDDETH